MIKASGIEFTYDDNKQFIYPDFLCNSNEELLVLGPSGSGKTTFLHLLCGFLKPSSGLVEVAGQNIFELSESELDQYRANTIGIVFQDNYFIQSISIRENLRLAQKFASKKIDDAQIDELATDLNLLELMDKFPSQLSRGEQQRASIIRALLNEPALLLADEPTSSLDDLNCAKVLKILKEIKEKNKSALIVVSHDSRLKSEFTKSISL